MLTERADVRIDPGSFQDRESRVVYFDNRIFRALSPRALSAWDLLQGKPFFQRMVTEGKIIPSRQVESPDIRGILTEEAGLLEHQRIQAISYPYEWSFGMLKDAALLHLELLLAALDEDMMLKDSSAYNVQWQGAHPVFIDVGSFEALNLGAPWVGYRQFCQMFLYPLLLQAYKNVSFHPWMRGSIQGISPQDFCNLLSLPDLLKPGVFVHGFLHARLQQDFADLATGSEAVGELKATRYSPEMIRGILQGLQKIIGNLDWQEKHSTWSDYADHNTYDTQARQEKAAFVEQVIAQCHWPLVWDIGCNAGNFSRIAARNADYVLALDSDHLTVEHLYQRLKQEKIGNILPLVYNLADPSPGLGWQGQERKPLEERAKPDLILCLALIHHMVIQHNIPLKDFVNWLAGFNSSLIIEFVDREDPMVKRLLTFKQDNYKDYEPANFERCLGEAFHLERKQTLSTGTRTLYYCRVK